MVKEEVSKRKRWVCCRLRECFEQFAEILEKYVHRHSERLSQHAETKAAEARLIPETYLLLSANIINCQNWHDLKYEVKMFILIINIPKLMFGLSFNLT